MYRAGMCIRPLVQSAHFQVTMSRSFVLAILALLLTACGVNNQNTPAPPLYTSGVPFPASYRDTFVHYARVDRPDGVTRDLYISPEAVAALQRGLPLPDETTIVIEAHHAALDANGDYLRDENGWLVKDAPFEMLHVIQKRSGWTDADFESAARAGSWNFGSYDPATGERFDESLTACFNCHNGTPQTDFVYSRRLLQRYASTDLMQYFYCNLRARAVCP